MKNHHLIDRLEAIERRLRVALRGSSAYELRQNTKQALQLVIGLKAEARFKGTTSNEN